MRYALIILAFSIFSNSQAQLVVDLVDFASNPSKYNGRYIVLRGVFITKTTGNTIALSGPRTLNPTSPTGGLSPTTTVNAGSPTNPTISSGPGQVVTLNAATVPQTPTATTTTSTRPSPCTPPRNWEALTVEIPNYTGCFMLYNSMARTLPNGRRANADITIFVDVNVMHRIARVKLN
jgi:hypothetical protein